MLTPLLYEREVIRQEAAGRLYLQWRRQGHKTTTLAKKALKFMIKRPGGLVTFASASLLVGSEMIVREGEVVESAREAVRRDALALQAAFEATRAEAESANLKLETNGDDLPPDDFADLFERQKLEARIWHARTVFSRTKARGRSSSATRSLRSRSCLRPRAKPWFFSCTAARSFTAWLITAAGSRRCCEPRLISTCLPWLYTRPEEACGATQPWLCMLAALQGNSGWAERVSSSLPGVMLQAESREKIVRFLNQALIV